MNFGAIRNCPAKFPLATNPTNEDINHPVYARDNRMKNVPEDFRLEIHSPDLRYRI